MHNDQESKAKQRSKHVKPRTAFGGQLRKGMTERKVARGVVRRRSKASGVSAPGYVTAMLIGERSEREVALVKGVARSFEIASNVDQRKGRELDMGSKTSIKYHRDPKGGRWFHLYRECFDLNNEFVYLELGGVPFEAASSVDVTSETGHGSITVRIPEEWGRRLGLVRKAISRKAARRKEKTAKSRKQAGTAGRSRKERKRA